MARSPAAWLLAELPQLERDKIVDAETAARLRARYTQDAQSEPQLAAPLTALLGALLVGLGLILLIAHNWDQWPLTLRLIVAALPLAAAQAACVYTLRRRSGSRVWRESSALLTGLAAAALLALVAQIFHFRGDLHLYLLSCILLALPLVYILDASLLAALLAAAMLGMVAAEPMALRQPWHALLLFSSLLPHLLQLWRQAPASLRLSLLLALWTLLLAAALSLAITPLRAYGWLWCAELGALLLLAEAGSKTLASLSWRPLRAGGEMLWAIVALAASFPEFWRGERYGAAHLLQANVVLQIALLLVLGLALRALLRRQWLIAATALPALLLAMLQGQDLPESSAAALVLLANAYVLLMGVAIIVQGLRQRELRRISGGLTLLAALVLLRFFGSEWPFVVRGLAFVAVGLGFLFAHAWLRRRLKTA